MTSHARSLSHRYPPSQMVIHKHTRLHRCHTPHPQNHTPHTQTPVTDTSTAGRSTTCSGRTTLPCAPQHPPAAGEVDRAPSNQLRPAEKRKHLLYLVGDPSDPCPACQRGRRRQQRPRTPFTPPPNLPARQQTPRPLRHPPTCQRGSRGHSPQAHGALHQLLPWLQPTIWYCAVLLLLHGLVNLLVNLQVTW